MAGKILTNLGNLFNNIGANAINGVGDQSYSTGKDKNLDAKLAKIEKTLSSIDNMNARIVTLTDEREKNHLERNLLDARITKEDDEATKKHMITAANKLSNIIETSEKKEKKEKELIEKANKAVEDLYAQIEKSHKLSKDQQDLLLETIRNGDADLKRSGNGLAESLANIHGHAQNGFGSILSGTRSFLIELGAIGELMGQALHQIEALNRDLVAFNRSMSQGNMNNQMFGMDLYGNSQNGVASLTSVMMQNAISEKDFLSSFQAFSKGKAMGTGEKDFASQQDDMNKFGIAASQLSKFYGVEMGTINTITSNLVYNFGTKVKDLNGIFEDGKEAATAAGVSVREYFNNLKEATDMLGKYYIQGGIQGLKDLSLYATETNQTVGQVLASTDRFKNFTSQFELQNNAAALGFANASANMVKAWGYSMEGDKATAQKIFIASIAKDLKNNGGAVDGKVSAIGMMNMQQLGLSEEEIKTTQRLLNMSKELGISIEQLTDRNKLDLDQKAKIFAFEHQNLTLGERLSEMWGKIRTVLIDPLASVLAPVLSAFISIGNILGDVIYVLGSPLIWPLKMLANGISSLVWVFDWIGSHLEPIVKAVNDQFEKLNKSAGWVLKTLGGIVGFLEVMLIGRMFTPLLVGLLKTFTSSMTWITGKLSPPAATLTRAGTTQMTAAQELMIAARALRTAAFARSGGGGPGGIGGVGGAGGIGGSISGGRGLFGIGTRGSWSMGGVMKGIGRGGGTALVGNAIGMGLGAMGHEKAGDAVSTTADWAGMGAMVGSVIPGLGTLAGGIIGGLIGVVKAIWDTHEDDKKDNDKQKFEGASTTNFVNSRSIEDILKNRQGLNNKWIDNGGGNIPNASQAVEATKHIHVTVKAVAGQHATTTLYE